MILHRPYLVGLGLLAAIALPAEPAWAGPKLTGQWVLQALNADREFTLIQRGRRLEARRIIQANMGGVQHRLEHAYRGVIKGARVAAL